LSAAGHSLSVVCAQCRSILDAKDPNLQVLEKFEAKQSIKPVIPLGTRGKLEGAEYTIIGFQVRSTDVDDMPDSWDEYLLFNRYKGFRYLTLYNGHWNYVKTVPASPERIQVGKKPGAKLMGHTYVMFDTALATTSYVLANFRGASMWARKTAPRISFPFRGFSRARSASRRPCGRSANT